MPNIPKHEKEDTNVLRKKLQRIPNRERKEKYKLLLSLKYPLATLLIK